MDEKLSENGAITSGYGSARLSGILRTSTLGSTVKRRPGELII